jgi:uncharacterized protein (TIGR02687 family)
MSSSSHIDTLFRKHRVVFWYDPNHEFRQDVAEYSNPDVTVVTIDNNQLQLKYQLLMTEPERKFLVYAPSAEPSAEDNWLLDIQLAQAVYRNDRVSLWLDELDWPATLRDQVTTHAAFFANKERRRALHTLMPRPTPTTLVLGMIAVTCNARCDINDIVLRVFDNARQSGDDSSTDPGESSKLLVLLRQYDLLTDFWLEVAATYNYHAAHPTLLDFVYALYGYAYAESLRETTTSAHYTPAHTLNSYAIALLRAWQDSTTYASAYNHYARLFYSQHTTLQLNLEAQDLAVLSRIEWFVAVDRLLVDKLVHAILERTLTHSEIDRIIRLRLQGYWLRADQGLKTVFHLLQQASALLHLVNTQALTIDNPQQAISRYTTDWYKIDQHYRHFIAARSATVESLSEIIQPLIERVEDHYINSYLSTVNLRWQDVVTPMQQWPWPGAVAQRSFYERVVKPTVAHKKLCVVVADGLRYEMAEELQRELSQTSSATLSAMIGVLPSYTQLGQAALLPHSTLEIRSDVDSTVLVDGRASAGIANRTQIIQTNSGVASMAYTYEDFTAKNSDERRAIIRDHQLVYIYHTSIDTTGENQEQTLCGQSAQHIEELRKLVTNLLASHASNVIITADHGFLYQHRVPAEGEFMPYQSAASDTIVSQNRRMVIGSALADQPSLKKWRADQLGLLGTTEVQIPYSIMRLRRQGTQKHYSHGGASLQEVIVPVITVNRVQTNTVQRVPVTVVDTGSTSITTTQATVRFYQAEPVSDGYVARHIRAVFVAADGTEITPAKTLTFDSPSAVPRDRETPVVFVLSAEAKQYNKQQVFLSIAEHIVGSAQYNEIERRPYKLNRSVIYDDDDE